MMSSPTDNVERYAVLGATGMIGSSCMQAFFDTTTAEINCLVRSKSKLHRTNPAAAASPRICVFQGDINEIDTLIACLTDVSAVVLTVACPSNKPGVRIAQDQVECVVAALSRIRAAKANVKLPRLLLLSSAEAENEPHFTRNMPWPVRTFLLAAGANVYNDLLIAESYLRKQDWLNCVVVKPGGLSHDEPSGHKISEEEKLTWLSLADLGAAMVELAQDKDGRWDGKSVSVLNRTGKSAKVNWNGVRTVLKGFAVHWFPWLHDWLF